MRYLVDTDWVIHYLNGHPEIVARIQDLGPHSIALSVISVYISKLAWNDKVVVYPPAES